MNIEVELKLLNIEVIIMHILLEIFCPQIKETFSTTMVKHFQQPFLQKNNQC